MKKLIALLSLFAGLTSAFAQTVPSLMNYQGRLTDEAGNPLTNGQYRLAFRLYTNTIPVASEPLIWGREYEVTLIGGVFNVVLGAPGGGPVAEPAAVNNLTFAFTEPNRFLELRVIRDGVSNTVNRTILPRQQLLSAPYAIMAGNGVPPGTIMAFGGTSIPFGWLLCDGRAVSSSQYPRLFSAISKNWGAGIVGTSQDFNLPDFQGYFLRGVSGGTVRDPDRDTRGAISVGGNTGNAVGSLQSDMLLQHRHDIGFAEANARTASSVAASNGDFEYIRSDLVDTTSFVGGSETRPKNAYVHFIVKY